MSNLRELLFKEAEPAVDTAATPVTSNTDNGFTDGNGNNNGGSG